MAKLGLVVATILSSTLIHADTGYIADKDIFQPQEAVMPPSTPTPEPDEDKGIFPDSPEGTTPGTTAPNSNPAVKPVPEDEKGVFPGEPAPLSTSPILNAKPKAEKGIFPPGQ